MAYIDGTNILINYDSDVENFIYTTGINNPANLSVSGLYTVDKAMGAVAALVSGLKSVKDIGQTLTYWERVVGCYIFISGVQATDAKNLKNPSTYPLTFFGTNTFGGTGWKPTFNSGYATAEITRNLFSLNSMSAFYYSGTNDNTITGLPQELGFQGEGTFATYGNTEIVFGQAIGGNLISRGITQTSTDATYSFPITANRPTTGLLGTSRINSTQMIRLRNYDGIVETLTNAVQTNFAGAGNTNAKLRLNHSLTSTGTITGYSNRECRLVMVGAGATATEMSLINHIVNYFESLLNRR